MVYKELVSQAKPLSLHDQVMLVEELIHNMDVNFPVFSPVDFLVQFNVV